ncbi:ATP-binding protein [Thermodesulforhabdus norvegica]|uniref:MinD superfamily P-loop ATPase, contains an inserted ferredoxin domain n=1 Tax=Thermodesulforhabdus norvegica TaxID=39841 RepID=A0A1I4VSU8_9BACT|nr:ATP-binding protein [Thermodesulforhabdus norvegica]SFN04260.1 MinD superfamily P-loop ATPase, contains an inserted ferredoxin domain [Thermodesulforhabdus norvegica]
MKDEKPTEIVIISGKGGTGKTSLTAAFASLTGKCVLADCDVDAADLHLIVNPEVVEVHEFWSGHSAVIKADRCNGCGVCAEYCRFDAVIPRDGRFWIDELSCEGCGLCVRLCPEEAVDFIPRLCGHWMISETSFGPMVHAQLGIGAENSGRLVSVVRKQAREIARRRAIPLVLVDGPPGIGCPVISSVTGADLVVVVVEPTLSGCHDMERVIGLAKHFRIPALVCLNRWDINEKMAGSIEKKARELGAPVVGRIPYNPAFTRAQLTGEPVVRLDGRLAVIIESIWQEIERAGGEHGVSWK